MAGKRLPIFELEAAAHQVGDAGKGWVSYGLGGSVCKYRARKHTAALSKDGICLFMSSFIIALIYPLLFLLEDLCGIYTKKKKKKITKSSR